MTDILAPPVKTTAGPRWTVVDIATRVVVVVTAVLVALGAASTDGFFSLDNARAIIISVSVVGILAIGMTAIMIVGSFASLSLGTTSAVMAMLFVHELPMGVVSALLVVVIVGAAACAVQGLLIGGWDANPIILTIAAGALLQGAATYLTGGRTVVPTTDNYDLLNARLFGLPSSVYVLVVLVVTVEAVLRRTTFGRQVYLVGENRRASKAAGLPLARTTAGAFALAGACAGLTGALLGAYNQGASMQLEGNLTFDAIAAALVGGTLVTGGRGAAWRTLLGALAIGVITNILLLRGYSTGTQTLLKGVLVGCVVVLVHLRSRSAGRVA